MFLKKLHLENFRQVESLDIEFDRINLFVARNAHGKSTVFKAIELLRTNKTEQPLEQYIRWHQEDPLIVHGIDSYNNKEIDYRIERSKDKSTAERLLIHDNNKYLNSDATGQMEKILDPVFAHYSAIAPQHESVNVLFEKSSVRLDKLKKIFGLDHIDEKVNELEVEIKECKIKIDSLKSEIKTLEGVQYEYQELPELPQIEDTKKDFNRLSSEKEEYEKKLKEYNDYIAKQQAYDKAQEEITVLEKELNVKLTQLEQYNELLSDVSEKDYYDLKNEIESARQKQKEYKSYLDIKSKHDITKSDIESIVIKRVRQNSITQADIDKLLVDKTTLEIYIKDLKHSIELSKEGKCPTCNQDYCIDIEEYETKLKESEQQKIKLESDIKSARQSLIEYEQIVNENNIASEKKKGLQTRLDELIKQLNECNVIEDPAITDKWIEEKELELNEIDSKIKKQNQFKEDKQNLQNEIIKKQTEIAEKHKVEKPDRLRKPVDFDYDTYNKLQKEINIYDQKLEEYNRVKLFNEDIDKKRNQKYLSITEKQKELDIQEHKKKVGEDSKKFLSKEFSSFVLKEKLDRLENAMNKFFASSLEPKYHIKVHNTSKDVEFKFTMDGEFYAPVLSFSGYERDLLAMAFRVGLLSLQNIGFMLVDEIDSMADSTNSIQLFDVLVQQDFIEQFFIITHKKETIEYLESEYGAKVFYIDELIGG